MANLFDFHLGIRLTILSDYLNLFIVYSQLS